MVEVCDNGLDAHSGARAQWWTGVLVVVVGEKSERGEEKVGVSEVFEI